MHIRRSRGQEAKILWLNLGPKEQSFAYTLAYFGIDPAVWSGGKPNLFAGLNLPRRRPIRIRLTMPHVPFYYAWGHGRLGLAVYRLTNRFWVWLAEAGR